MEGKGNHLVSLVDEVRVADTGGNIEGFVVVLGHFNESLDVFQQLLRFGGLFGQRLGQDDR